VPKDHDCQEELKDLADDIMDGALWANPRGETRKHLKKLLRPNANLKALDDNQVRKFLQKRGCRYGKIQSHIPPPYIGFESSFQADLD